MALPAPALLLLTDGRFPAGGYAHSAGLEASVRAGRVRDAATLESFLAGRATTTGLVAGAFAAAACVAVTDEDGPRLRELEAELDARTPSPALRATSRTLGRQLLRALGGIHPHPCLQVLPPAPHQAVAFGGAAAAFDLDPHAAALAALYDAVSGPAASAVKLLPVDPFTVHAALARLTPTLQELAATAAGYAVASPEELPAAGAPLLDVAAQQHARWEGRLFAS